MSTYTEPPFDTSEAARRLGVKRSWLIEHRDLVPFRRIGNFVRYIQADIDTYLARSAVDPNPLGRSDRSKAKTS